MSIRKPGWPTSWPGSPSIRPTGLMNSCRGIGGRVRRREVKRRDRGGHRSRLHHRLRRQHAPRGRRLAVRAVDRHVPGRRLPARLRRRRGRRDRLHQGRHRVSAADRRRRTSCPPRTAAGQTDRITRPAVLTEWKRRFCSRLHRYYTAVRLLMPSPTASSPRLPVVARDRRGGVRSPRFRRDPFIRDVASDPGRATVPRITAPHMLPSAVATASAPATSRISWLNPTPQMITVYASPWSSPSPTQHSLPGGRYPLPGPDFHRLDRARIDVRLCFGDRPRLGFLVYVKNGFGRGHENSPCALCIITHQLTGKLMLLPAGASVLASIRRTWFDASDPRARPVVRRMRFGIEIAGVEAPDVGQESF